MRKTRVRRLTAMAMSVFMAAMTLGSVTGYAAEETSEAVTEAVSEEAGQTEGIGTVAVEGGLVQGVESDTEGVTLFKEFPTRRILREKTAGRSPSPWSPGRESGYVMSGAIRLCSVL